MNWPIAKQRPKKFKLFMSGPPGCFKTRVALRLADNRNFEDPATAVIDTEFGSEHYGSEFAFRVPPIDPYQLDADEVYRLVADLVKKPGNIKTLIIDSFSVYYDMLIEKWLEKFLLREITSAGHKSDYYNLQPRDYNHINRDASKLVRALLFSDLNVICVCQIKNQYEFVAGALKIIGQTADGWKRMGYYFDTLIDVQKGKGGKGWLAAVTEKDRTNSFEIGEIIPWENDQKIVEHMVKKFGHSFYEGPAAHSFDPDTAQQFVRRFAEEGAEKIEEKVELGKLPPKLQQAAAPVQEAPPLDSGTVEKNTKPVKAETLMECLGEVRKLGLDKPELIAAVKNLYGHAKPSMMSEGEATELTKMAIRGDFPTGGNTVKAA